MGFEFPSSGTALVLFIVFIIIFILNIVAIIRSGGDILFVLAPALSFIACVCGMLGLGFRNGILLIITVIAAAILCILWIVTMVTFFLNDADEPVDAYIIVGINILAWGLIAYFTNQVRGSVKK